MAPVRVSCQHTSGFERSTLKLEDVPATVDRTGRSRNNGIGNVNAKDDANIKAGELYMYFSRGGHAVGVRLSNVR
jgi:hypothetical protein